MTVGSSWEVYSQKCIPLFDRWVLLTTFPVVLLIRPRCVKAPDQYCCGELSAFITVATRASRWGFLRNGHCGPGSSEMQSQRHDHPAMRVQDMKERMSSTSFRRTARTAILFLQAMERRGSVGERTRSTGRLLALSSSWIDFLHKQRWTPKEEEDATSLLPVYCLLSSGTSE